MGVMLMEMGVVLIGIEIDGSDVDVNGDI